MNSNSKLTPKQLESDHEITSILDISDDELDIDAYTPKITDAPRIRKLRISSGLRTGGENIRFPLDIEFENFMEFSTIDSIETVKYLENRGLETNIPSHF